MGRRVLASYFSEDKLADTLNEFKTKGYTSDDFLIFTAESNIDSIHTHTDDIMERLPSIRSSTNTGPLIKEIKQSFSSAVNPEPPVISLDKLIKLGISSEAASAYGSEADDGNILILINDEHEEGKEETWETDKDTGVNLSVKPGDQAVTDASSDDGNSSK